MKFCQHCGKENEESMTFCQNCGEKIKPTSVQTEVSPIATPTGNTIKNWANIVFGLIVALGPIIIIAGIALAENTDGISFLVGLVSGAITIALGFVSRAFVYGYGIIVSYCERRENE